MSDTRKILEGVASGEISVEEGLLKLKTEPFEDIGYARIDHHRGIRQGTDEVIYGEGKTADQITGIISSMIDHGRSRILITRLDPEKAEKVAETHKINYFEAARLAIAGEKAFDDHRPDGNGAVVIATGGTSDIPVAEEAAITAEFLGNEVVRLYDVGVAGIHRLLANKEQIMKASVIIAVAGMEGALASVVGGLADCPVIAVPTSVGYGASFGGLSALLSMLNSCASGVAVVNIDNGFGAGYFASMINHTGK
ncbi:MAG: nickel pincer cofactor biosynthesis protein LarB [Clostridiales bacterium]|nr:nickel pincer cofactor biosynthesis protein LarB [Clostridiales bacterium]